MSEQRKLQASRQRDSYTTGEKVKRGAKVTGKVLGALAIMPGLPTAVVMGIGHEIGKGHEARVAEMYQQLDQAGDVALGLIEASGQGEKQVLGGRLASFEHIDTDGSKSVGVRMAVDSEDNTLGVSLDTTWNSTVREGYGSSKELWVRYAVPADQVGDAFADGVVTSEELQGIVDAKGDLIGATTRQEIVDPEKEENEIYWRNYVGPDGYESPSAVTDGLAGLYEDVQKRTEDMGNRPVGWADVSNLSEQDAKDYELAQKAADYVKQGYPNLAEGILRQVDDAGKFTKVDAGDMVDPELAQKAAELIAEGRPYTAQSYLDMVDDAGEFTKADAQAVVDAASAER